MLTCQDCREHHENAEDAILCDWVRGKKSPNLSYQEQRRIAEGPSTPAKEQEGR